MKLNIIRNISWNFSGHVLPLAVAIFAIPQIINGLGTERFGVLTLAWMIIGYFGLFDFGLSRAITKLISEKIGNNQEDDIVAVIWTGLTLMTLLGIVGALIISFFVSYVVMDVLNIPEVLHQETLYSFYILSFSIPVVILSTGFRGVLEGYNRFDLTNAVRIPLGLYTFISPLIVLPFYKSLHVVIGVLLLGRIVSCLLLFVLCLFVVPDMRNRIDFKYQMIKPLIHFGSWMSVTNIVSPLMSYMDRFIIGAFVSIKMVAYYTTPFEVITKLLIIPVAVTGVLFPTFSAVFKNKKDYADHLFYRGLKYTVIILFPIVLIIISLSSESLDLWLGNEFSENSTRVLQWLSIGVFLNCVAQLPFTFIQSIGRPDLTGKLHISEFPFYLIVLWYMIDTMGIEGAAIAWVVRVFFDTFILLFIANKIYLKSTPILLRNLFLITIAVLVFCTPMILQGLTAKIAFLLTSLIIFGLISWSFFLTNDERGFIKQFKINIGQDG